MTMKTKAMLRESDKGGRAKLKRIAMLLSVVALMVVMLAMSVTPAFAFTRLDLWGCRLSDRFYTSDSGIYRGSGPDHNGDGKVCYYMNWNTGKWSYADNRLL
jgi:hypothetical protein